MRKFYSIVLMATALLIGTNAKADYVCQIGETQYESLDEAIASVPENGTATIDITANAQMCNSVLIDQNQDITINMHGFNVTANHKQLSIYHGKLNLAGNGVFTYKGHYSTAGFPNETDCEGQPLSEAQYQFANVRGTDDPKAKNYSVLTIGADVKIDAFGYAVAVQNLKVGSEYYSYGAVVNVYGTLLGTYGAISTNGYLTTKTGNVPLIHVYEGALVSCTDAAIYASGYARWIIEGTVQGLSGIYAKSGSITVQGNGVVRSTADTYVAPKVSNDGYSGGEGCAIIYDSNKAYAGGMELIVKDNATIETQTNGGYAILEAKTNSENSKTEAIVIESGTINGSVDMTAEMAEEVKVNGTITGGTFDTDVTEYLSNVTGVITPVVDENGKTTYVVEEKPAESDPWLADIATADADDYVRLTGSYSKTLDADAQAKYLVMQDNAKIIIPDGKKLTAGEIVMGQNTVIEVMAGGKLIITEKQGLVANFASNIVLHATEGNQSTFIMDPSVASNKNPKATVEFVSKAYYNGSSDYRNQRFGIPTIGALDNITADHTTRIWGYFNGQWDLIGTVVPGEEFDASVMDKPFAYYQMNNNNPNAGTKVTMTGRLVGVSDPALEVTANNWATFSNSFMADMNAQAMMAMFDGHDNIDATLQTYVPTSEDEFAWQPYNRINILFGEVDLVIQPMQAFIIKNNGAEDQLQINYNDMVWEPFVASLSAGAPRKRAALDMTTARIQVSNAAGVYDFVTLVADNQFSAEYENGYDAEHVMNNTLDLYTVGVKNLATMATDNLDNTVLGLSCAEAGEYTISFSHINGDNLTLIDRATGARIAMVEGNTYDFTVEAGEANRFEIVGRANMPTAIENTDAKNVKGAVYTITGQYVGSVENWNVLPAGVYVIDGVKCVK